VLPEQAEEVEPGRRGDAALVHEAAGVVEDRDLDPGVVDLKAGSSDHAAHVDGSVVAEAHRRSCGVRAFRVPSRGLWC
jgi:hypothetical protein